MSRVLGPLRSRAPYAFMVVGVAWIAVAVSVRSLLVLWPVVVVFSAWLSRLFSIHNVRHGSYVKNQ